MPETPVDKASLEQWIRNRALEVLGPDTPLNDVTDEQKAQLVDAIAEVVSPALEQVTPEGRKALAELGIISLPEPVVTQNPDGTINVDWEESEEP